MNEGTCTEEIWRIGEFFESYEMHPGEWLEKIELSNDFIPLTEAFQDTISNDPQWIRKIQVTCARRAEHETTFTTFSAEEPNYERIPR
jgi:hypothetical protein